MQDDNESGQIKEFPEIRQFPWLHHHLGFLVVFSVAIQFDQMNA